MDFGSLKNRKFANFLLSAAELPDFWKIKNPKKKIIMFTQGFGRQKQLPRIISSFLGKYNPKNIILGALGGGL